LTKAGKPRKKGKTRTGPIQAYVFLGGAITNPEKPLDSSQRKQKMHSNRILWKKKKLHLVPGEGEEAEISQNWNEKLIKEGRKKEGETS